MFCAAGIKLHFYQAVESGFASASQHVRALAGAGPAPAGSAGPLSDTELGRSRSHGSWW